MCLLLSFNKCTLYAQGQTASVSAKPCGLNFHRLGLPLIFICAYPQPQRVRFTECGAKVLPVLGSATSTEVLQPLRNLRCCHEPTRCYMIILYQTAVCEQKKLPISFALCRHVRVSHVEIVVLLSLGPQTEKNFDYKAHDFA